MTNVIERCFAFIKGFNPLRLGEVNIVDHDRRVRVHQIVERLILTLAISRGHFANRFGVPAVFDDEPRPLAIIMMVVIVVVIVLVVPLFFFFVPLVVEAFVRPLSCDIDRAARNRGQGAKRQKLFQHW